MEHQETSFEIFDKFTWKIENFSHFNNVEKIYSEPFVLGGYPWRISLYPRGDERNDNLSIFLEAVQMQTDNVPKGWSRDVKFKLLVFNQLDTNLTTSIQSKREFNASSNGWGISSFMPLVKLHDPQKGFILKDVCIVGAEVFVCKPTQENRVSQAARLTGNTNVEVPRPKPEFKGSNLEIHSPFSTLICIEPTGKVRDMNDQACKDLQGLWEELEKFRSDLTWLEPHVQSSLGIKNYVEKALHVEKLKENLVSLELEIKRTKTKLVAAEANLDMERNLLKSKGI